MFELLAIVTIVVMLSTFFGKKGRTPLPMLERRQSDINAFELINVLKKR